MRGEARGKAEGEAEGEARGKAEGKSEGMLEGEIKATKDDILCVLTARFSAALADRARSVITPIQNADILKLSFNRCCGYQMNKQCDSAGFAHWGDMTASVAAHQTH